MSIETNQAVTPTAANTPEPKNWEQAIALALITGNTDVLKVYRKAHPDDKAGTLFGEGYGLDCAPNGITYSECEGDATGPYCLDNLDPAALKASLEKRAAIFRAAAQEMGLNIEDAYYFRNLKGIDGDITNLSDYELGLGLEEMTIMRICGAPRSRALVADILHPLPDITIAPDINAKVYGDGPQSDIIELLYAKTEGHDLTASPFLSAIETSAIFGTDGEVSKQDWIRHFASHDRNGDNKMALAEDISSNIYSPLRAIGREQFADNIQKAAAAKFDYLDVSKDGTLTLEELNARMALRTSVTEGLAQETESALNVFMKQPKQKQRLDAEVAEGKATIIAEGKANIDKHIEEWTINPMFSAWCQKNYKNEERGAYWDTATWIWEKMHKDPKVLAAFDAYLKSDDGSAAYTAARAKTYNDNMRYYENQAAKVQPSWNLTKTIKKEFLTSRVDPTQGMTAKELLAFDLKYAAAHKK